MHTDSLRSLFGTRQGFCDMWLCVRILRNATMKQFGTQTCRTLSLAVSGPFVAINCYRNSILYTSLPASILDDCNRRKLIACTRRNRTTGTNDRMIDAVCVSMLFALFLDRLLLSLTIDFIACWADLHHKDSRFAYHRFDRRCPCKVKLLH